MGCRRAARARSGRRGRRTGSGRRPRRSGLARRGDGADDAARRHRAGRSSRRPAGDPVRPPRCGAARRSCHVDGGPVGRRDPRRAPVRAWRLRHEGRRRVDPGRRPVARGQRRHGPALRRAAGRARPVRGGRRPGHPGGDPRRRDRRPRDHHGAVGARCRRRPRRGDHVPADRPRPRRPRLATPRGSLRARQAVRALEGARGGRGAPQRGRDRSADDRPRAAVPDDHRDRRGWGVGVDGAGPRDRGRPLWRPARPVRPPTPRPSCGRASRPRAPADDFLRDHP